MALPPEKFDHEAARGYVDRWLAARDDIPPNKHVAFVGWTNLKGSYRFEAVTKIGDFWKAGVALSSDLERGHAFELMFKGAL